jgi:DNA-binding PadR family transcriptional regulator
VYPALTALRAEQLVEEVAEGRRSTYTPTAGGRALLADKQDLLAQVEARTSTALRGHESLEPLLARFTDRIIELSGRVDPAAVERALDHAVQALTDQAARTIIEQEVRHGA